MIRRRALWTALRYPALAIDRLPPDEGARPRVIATRVGALHTVMLADAWAIAARVRPGVRVSSALALAPGLEVIVLDPREDAAHLDQLALAALRYPSHVTPEPPERRAAASGCSGASRRCSSDCTRTRSSRG